MKSTNNKGDALNWYRLGLDDGFNGTNARAFYTSSRRAYNKGYKAGIKLYKKHLKESV